ncbi:MAG: 30S ribosomal protein S4 [Candidatus Levybacteria bacterium]|nr:30S ribosomal protein S4 [Candidatus Levybacteria bacterium]
MARYRGPKHRLARREGENILDKTSASLQRRLAVPPGVHGRKGKRRLSEYGTQLREKQKAKAIYGVLEKQLRRLVNEVAARKGDTGELLLSMLETRLDNITYRLGFAKTRYMARQLVSHGHVYVNGKKLSIPSYSVRKDDVISLSPKLKSKFDEISAIPNEKDLIVLPFLSRKKDEGVLTRLPKREDIEVPFNLQLIIEYYSR